MMGLDFVQPDYLWFMLLLVPLFLTLRVLENLRMKRTLLVSNPQNRLPLKFRYWSLMPLLISALSIIAISRPYFGSETIDLPGAVKDILILQDVSKSMLAQDLKPSRLEFSKRKIQDIVKYASNKITNSRIGLILFSGESYLYCPLTEDYGVLDYFIKSISTDLITNQGTAIDDALSTAAKSLEEVKSKDAAIILVTDGEDSELNVSSTLDFAKRFGIKINVLATGTVEGSPIPEPFHGFVKDKEGNIVLSKLAEISLREIAEGSGGIYKKAELSNSDIVSILGAGLKENKEVIRKNTFTVYNEKGHFFILAALLISITAVLFKKEALIFVFIFYALPLSQAEAEDAPVVSLNEAHNAYKNGDYEKAKTAFEYYYKKEPENLKISQSYASSLYKLGKYKEASDIFKKNSEAATEGKPKFEALYNKGNSDFMQKDYKSAIKSYEEALTIKEADPDTIANLELAKKKLAEEMAKPTPTPTPTPSPDPNQTPQNKDEQNKDQQNKEDKQNKEEQNKDNQNQDNDKNKEEQEKSEKEKEENKQNDNKDQDKKDENDKKDSEDSSEKENKEQSEGQEQIKELSEEEMKEQEAKAWLESLSDTPVLLRRKVSNSRSRNKQQW